MPYNILIFFLILTNAGGEGKTTLTFIIRALLDLVSSDCFALDADPATWALKNRYGECVDTQPLSWHPKADAAAKIASKTAGRPLLMDTGTSMMNALSPVTDLVFELQRRFSLDGYRTAVLLPLTPNRSRVSEGIYSLADKLTGFEQYVVLNHRDQSTNFGPLREDLPRLVLGHLPSGLQAYLDTRDWHIADVVLNPEPGFTKASAHIGEWVRQFALDEGVQSILPPELCIEAIRRLPPTPPVIRFAMSTLEDVTDHQLMINERASVIRIEIDRHGWSPSGLRAAADALEAKAAQQL